MARKRANFLCKGGPSGQGLPCVCRDETPLWCWIKPAGSFDATVMSQLQRELESVEAFNEWSQYRTQSLPGNRITGFS
ncbi:hypothetical protein MPNT_50040 [Candidatus Methylacidithermus pantelleriae]|uniref:Uncharacterized protein n=1 Tax=Candidatus Methylacidithermus pantelleriae TaxID=2744239 RepID=A0A8J2BVH1_9BACT|nr:hypothetical protein MPNT_50040 [Candidatus Methylacidithermus pantelleriae]